MDKSKNRTDLLAAGRKKLQQFRQKKDGKGGITHGKSSKKQGKSELLEADVDVKASLSAPVASVHGTEQETAAENSGQHHDGSDAKAAASVPVVLTDAAGLKVASSQHSESNLVIAETSMSAALEGPMVCTLSSIPASKSTPPSLIPDIQESELLISESSLRDSGGDEASSSRHFGEATVVGTQQMNEGDTACVESQEALESEADVIQADRGDGIEERQALSPCDVSEESAIAVGLDDQIGDGREDVLLSNVYAHHGSLAQKEAAQDADYLVPNQYDGGGELKSQEDKVLRFPKFTQTDIFSKPTQGDIIEAKQVAKAHEFSFELNPANDLQLSLSFPVIDRLGESIHGEETVAQSENTSDDENKSAEADMKITEIDNGYKQIDNAKSFVIPHRGTDKFEGLFGRKAISSSGDVVSYSGNLQSISFSDLMEAIKVITEDEFGLLLKARDPDHSSLLQRKSDFGFQAPVYSGDMEWLEEELFSTYLMKELLSLQLKENFVCQKDFVNQCYHLLDGISLLHTSLGTPHKKSDSHAKELSQFRSEHQVAVHVKGDFYHHLLAARDEVGQVHGRLLELQNSLALAEENLSSLASEMAACKGSIAGFEVERERMNGILASVSKERNTLEEEKNCLFCENKKLSEELVECQKLMKGLQAEMMCSREDFASLMDSSKKHEEEREALLLEQERLSTELASYKNLAELLECAKTDLNETLIAVKEEAKNASMERGDLASECQRLSSEIIVLQEQLSMEQGEVNRLKEDLKGKKIHLGPLTEENVPLTSKSNACLVNTRELDDSQDQRRSLNAIFLNQSETAEAHEVPFGNSIDSDVLEGLNKKGAEVPVAEKPSFEYLGIELSLDPSECDIGFLKVPLQNIEETLQKLEKAIDGMQSYSTFLSKAGDNAGKVATAGVSKLIKAFELKTHSDEFEEEVVFSEDQSKLDLHAFSQEQIQNLKIICKQLVCDTQSALGKHRRELEGRVATDLTIRDLNIQMEILREHANNLEASYIEGVVLGEVLKQGIVDVKLSSGELEALCKCLRQQNIVLEDEKSELHNKLRKYNSTITHLENYLNQLQQKAGETSVLQKQFESLQNKVVERTVMLQLEWNVLSSNIVETLSKLDRHTNVVMSHAFDGLDLTGHVDASVGAAIGVIETLQGTLERVCKDHDAVSRSFEGLSVKLCDLQGMNDLAVSLLHNMYSNCRELVLHSQRSTSQDHYSAEDSVIIDPLYAGSYDALVGQLRSIVDERLQLESKVNDLHSQLKCRMEDIQELNSRCLDMDFVQKIIKEAETVVKLDDASVDFRAGPVLCLESLFAFLVKKYMELNKHIPISREIIISKEIEFTDLMEKFNQSCSLNIQHENEILILRETLSQAQEALNTVCAQLYDKIVELEQSEQRVSSLREKLGIAVAKGKGLVVQRDSLKQSLSEATSELERCSQELQLKESKLVEMEIKLGIYSEAGERVEALESELSYIRNSATALRESFLIKDSLLQRIEEILEDLDLPEHFHAKDIIEKVDWLARSVIGTSLPSAEWDQKSSIGGTYGGSYADTGLVLDSWREDMQPTSVSGDDLRRKYDELQGKFYGLAEQNEMLEQSLMERNYLVQRWEGLLDRIDMPSHVRTVEPEEKIEWLCKTLLEANHERSQLQQKIDEFDNYCSSLTADLAGLQERISHLEADLEVHVLEKEKILERLEISMKGQEDFKAKAKHFELENERLQSEATAIQRRLAELVEYEKSIEKTDQKLRRLQEVVSNALLDADMECMGQGEFSIGTLEKYLQELVDKYHTLSSAVVKVDALPSGSDSANTLDGEKSGSDGLKQQLEDALSELLHVKEERDKYMDESKSLSIEAEALRKKREEIQDLLNQEEQKMASLREKLNVAVRKGKSLVQQRDSLKQTIEEMNLEVAQLKSEINHKDNVVTDFEQKIMELSSYSDKAERLESEVLYLRNSLMETQTFWEDKGHTLNTILSTLADIDVGIDVSCSDPVEKLRQFEQLCQDLHSAVSSSEKESQKSRRAAELLLAELNEVQERNDSLQEEITRMSGELSRLTVEKEASEASKLKAISEFENLSALSAEERRKLSLELMLLKSTTDLLRKVLSDIRASLDDVLSKDLDILHKLEAAIGSCGKKRDSPNLFKLNDFTEPLSFVSNDTVKEDNLRLADLGSDPSMLQQLDENVPLETCTTLLRSQLQESVKGVISLEEDLLRHVASFQGQANRLFQLKSFFNEEVISQESFAAIQRDVECLKCIEKEKNMEIASLQRIINFLLEACSVSLIEIENSEASLIDKSHGNVDDGMKLDERFNTHVGCGGKALPSEEYCRSLAERLLLCIKEYSSVRCEFWERSEKEFKATIAKLQEELYEKDVERDRICKELVNQIKKAEAAAMGYSSDLQSSKLYANELEEKLKTMEEEQKEALHKLKELEDQQMASTKLEERVRSLTDVVASKDQEIEALMQALDEEELQMEQLSNKIEELEKLLRERNLALKDLEVSRGKALKKLSVTVSKFDELHNFSVSLLTEIENLQSHIKEQDVEISFLRQEVTRCTDEVIASSRSNNNAVTEEFYELLTWFDNLLSEVAFLQSNNMRGAQLNDCKELLQKKITTISTELEDLRNAAQGKDALLQAERSKVQELMQRGESLANVLHEKEYQLSLLPGIGDSGQQSGLTSEIMEVEPVRNKRIMSATTSTPLVRSLRKGNNDQVAIAIDMDPGSNSQLEDEDDDKVHGFKSLTTSRFVPKFTRRVTDMVDGLWVSCDRTLMRQPTLRLAIIIYWAVLHALLATFIV